MALDDDADSSTSSSDDTHHFRREHVVVSGAGLDVVNGKYEWAGVFDGVGMYSKYGVWQGERREFSLFRCNTSNSTKRWFLSIVPHGVQPGTDMDTDFYNSSRLYTTTPNDFPPKDSWRTSSEGKAPAPLVRVLDIAAISVAPEVAMAFKGMLFSEEFSDIRLICDDGALIPAHKNILAATSPYFKAVFTGPWKENQSGELNMPHSASLIRAMLTLLYTGELNPELIEQDPFAFMSLSSEYDIEWAKPLVEPICTRSIDEMNLKTAWQCACLHNSTLLKKACIQYAKGNPIAALAHGDITSLKTEDPAAWDEFSKAISDGKRKREAEA